MFPGNFKTLDVTTRENIDFGLSDALMRLVNDAGDRTANTEFNGRTIRIFSVARRVVSEDVLGQIQTLLGENYISSRYVLDEEAFPCSLHLP